MTTTTEEVAGQTCFLSQACVKPSRPSRSSRVGRCRRGEPLVVAVCPEGIPREKQSGLLCLPLASIMETGGVAPRDPGRDSSHYAELRRATPGRLHHHPHPCPWSGCGPPGQATEAAACGHALRPRPCAARVGRRLKYFSSAHAAVTTAELQRGREWGCGRGWGWGSECTEMRRELTDAPVPSAPPGHAATLQVSPWGRGAGRGGGAVTARAGQGTQHDAGLAGGAPRRLGLVAAACCAALLGPTGPGALTRTLRQARAPPRPALQGVASGLIEEQVAWEGEARLGRRRLVGTPRSGVVFGDAERGQREHIDAELALACPALAAACPVLYFSMMATVPPLASRGDCCRWQAANRPSLVGALDEAWTP